MTAAVEKARQDLAKPSAPRMRSSQLEGDLWPTAISVVYYAGADGYSRIASFGVSFRFALALAVGTGNSSLRLTISRSIRSLMHTAEQEGRKMERLLANLLV
jgi:hypothetical protein